MDQQQQQQLPRPRKEQINQKYKTSICRHFLSGRCQLGLNCQFAHGDFDIRKSSDPLPHNMPEFQKVNYNFNYKTLKCKFYEEKGECKNLDNCNYAHGDTELRAANSSVVPLPSPFLYPQGFWLTDSQLQCQALLYIIKHLEAVLSTDPKAHQLLQQAEIQCYHFNFTQASHLIQDIMTSGERKEEEMEEYQRVWTVAQNFVSSQQQYLLPFG